MRTTASGSYSSESGVWTVGGLPVGGTSSLTIVAKLLTDQAVSNLAESGQSSINSIPTRRPTTARSVKTISSLPVSGRA
jgi:hypothetical protein